MKIFIDVPDNARLVWVSSSTRTCRQCGPLTSTGYTKRHVTRDVMFGDIKQILEQIWNLIFLDDYNILDSFQNFLWYFICVQVSAKLWFEFQQHWPGLVTRVCWFIAIVWTAGQWQWPVMGLMTHVTCHVSRSLTTPESLWTGWMSVSGSGTHSVTITR